MQPDRRRGAWTNRLEVLPGAAILISQLEYGSTTVLPSTGGHAGGVLHHPPVRG